MIGSAFVPPVFHNQEENDLRIATMIAIALLVLVPVAWRAVRRRKDRIDHAFFVAAVHSRGSRPLDPTWTVPDRPPSLIVMAAHQDNDEGGRSWTLPSEVRHRSVDLVGRLGLRAGRRPLDLAPDPKSIYPLIRPPRESVRE